MGFSFVHAADLHLDTPFKGMGAAAPPIAAALRDASLAAFDRLVELCLERQAAFVVIAGDVYDGAERGLRAQLRFRDGLGRLSEAGIRSFVVHGNHDPIGGWSAVSDWPPLATIFGTDAVGSVEVRLDGEVVAVVHGISYWRRDVRENLALRFARTSRPSFQVGVLHCNVTGAADGYDDYSPCSLEDLARSGLDYWALGHIHSTIVLSGRPHGEEPYVVYPGNLQARSPKPSERGPKGAIVVRVEDDRVACLEHVPCDVVRFDDIDIDIAGCRNLDAVHAKLFDVADERLESSDGRSLVLRGRLAGRSEAHRALARPGVLDELLDAVRSELAGRIPFCWWDRLLDASASPLDLAAVRAGSDLAGDLVRLADELMADPVRLAELLVDASPGLPKGLKARAAAMSATGAGGMLEPALTLALDELGVDV